MSSNFKYKSGLGSVGAYQMSGVPFVKQIGTIPVNGGTPVQVDFPGVTKYIIVENLDDADILRVGFSAAGITGSQAGSQDIGCYWELLPNSAVTVTRAKIRMDVRVSSIFLLSDHGSNTIAGAQVHAGCTVIPTGTLPDNWRGIAGVGGVFS
jgi:hypothetical protein